MKNKNKVLQILIFILTFSIFLYANAADVNLKIKDVAKQWENTLKVNFDTKLPESWIHTGEMKIFKDLSINKSTKDTIMNNKIIVSLNDEIKIWNTYNIFSVFWVDGSADFIVEDGLTIKMLSELTEPQWITKVTLIDNKTLELYFKNPLIWNEFEFKWLEDLNVKEIKSLSWSIILETSSQIENKKDYILIFMSLADNLWNNYFLSESIHNFTIWNDIVNPVTEPSKLTWQVENLWNTENWTWNIENIAVIAEETPDTGPETWILMLLTLIINSIYFLTRKFSH